MIDIQTFPQIHTLHIYIRVAITVKKATTTTAGVSGLLHALRGTIFRLAGGLGLGRTARGGDHLPSLELGFPAILVALVLLAVLGKGVDKIIIALVLRGIFIAAGTAIITRFSSAFFIFGAFLIYTAYKLLREDGEKEEEPEDSRIVKFMRSKGASSFTIALITLGVTDLVFALDSIPATFGVTQEPFLVFSANAFALLGLRALYFLLKGLLDKLVYLSLGLSVILIFIGMKLILLYAHEVNETIPKISTSISLVVIAAILVISTVASFIKVRKDPTARAHAGRITDAPKDTDN